LTYKEVDAVLSGHLDTKLDGADVKEIQILHVSS
jgi:protein SSD1